MITQYLTEEYNHKWFKFILTTSINWKWYYINGNNNLTKQMILDYKNKTLNKLYYRFEIYNEKNNKIFDYNHHSQNITIKDILQEPLVLNKKYNINTNK